MAINFVIDDVVVVKTSYLSNTLLADPVSKNLRKTTQLLGHLGTDPNKVLATGQHNNSYYIKLLPLNIYSSIYRNGKGVVLYFETETSLNNSFELSTAYLPDKISYRALNVSGSLIPKGSVVFQLDFDDSTQLPTIDLADAGSQTPAKALAITEEDIENNGIGTILISGAYQGLDTSAFSHVQETVFLSDTPGAIQNTQGTFTVKLGQVLSISSEGAIYFQGIAVGGQYTAEEIGSYFKSQQDTAPPTVSIGSVSPTNLIQDTFKANYNDTIIMASFQLENTAGSTVEVSFRFFRAGIEIDVGDRYDLNLVAGEIKTATFHWVDENPLDGVETYSVRALATAAGVRRVSNSRMTLWQ